MHEEKYMCSCMCCVSLKLLRTSDISALVGLTCNCVMHIMKASKVYFVRRFDDVDSSAIICTCYVMYNWNLQFKPSV